MHSTKNTKNILPEISDLQDISIATLIQDYTPKIAKMLDAKGLSGKDTLHETMQELYLRMNKANENKVIKNYKAFLFGTLYNLIKEKCRERKKHNELFSDVEDETILCQKAAQENPFLMAELNEIEQNKLNHLLSVIEIHLKPIQKKVILKRFLEEKTTKQISHDLQLTETNVRAISSRALKRLRNIML